MAMRTIVLCLACGLALTGLSGCGQSKPVLNGFLVEVDKGKEPPELILRTREKGDLQEVNLNVDVTFEDGKNEAYTRVWSFWNEPKRIPLPKGSKVEKVVLSGTCVRVNRNQGQACDIRYMERFR